MDRVRRFLANPYKIRTLVHRLSRSVRQRLVARRLEHVQPESLRQHLQLDTVPAAHFRTRAQPRFFFDAERIPAIIAATPQEGKERFVQNAQSLLTRTFALRSLAPVTFTDEIDWRFTADHDRDWNADLHRLDWVATALLAAHYTQDGTFTERASSLLTHWWRANPPGSAPWRDPFEVAQRGNTLSWILFLGASLPTFSAEALGTVACALLTSGYWTEATLEYHVPNNHLFIEVIRLTQLGLLFPEFPWAQRWLRRGLGFLEREIERQVLPDGVHAERSVLYHRIVLEALLELIALAARNDLILPPLVYERSRRMVSFLRNVQRPDGEFPLLGDSFPRDTLLRYDLLAAAAELLGTDSTDGQPDERTLWLLDGCWPTPVASTQALHAQVWMDGGYAVFDRAGPQGRNHLVCDFGEFGMAAAPGHGHADCLSLDLCVSGRPFLIDAGAYSSYRGEHWRNAFRCTRAHNTVLVDGTDQTPLSGIFGAGRFAVPTLHTAILGDWLRLLDASHDGYRRLRGKVVHRRSIIEIPHDGWLVIDFLTGKGRHEVEVLWHFHPAVSIALTDSALHAHDASGAGLQMVWSASVPVQPRVYRGQEKPPLGWISLEAGSKEPADVLVLGAQPLLPAWIATLLTPGKEPIRQPRLRVLPSADGVALACAVDGITTSVFFATNGKRGGAFAEWSTDATIAVVRESPEEQAFLLAGGRLLQRLGEKRVSLPAITNGVALTVVAEQLHVQGDAQCPLHIGCGPIRQAFINGKEAKSFAEGSHTTRVET